MKGRITKYEGTIAISYDTCINGNLIDNRYVVIHKDDLPIDLNLIGKEVEFEIVREYGTSKDSIPATYAKITIIKNTWDDIFKTIEDMDVYLPLRLKNLIRNKYENPKRK